MGAMVKFQELSFRQSFHKVVLVRLALAKLYNALFVEAGRLLFMLLCCYRSLAEVRIVGHFL